MVNIIHFKIKVNYQHMSSKSYIQLKTPSISNVPIQTYGNFTFIVNGEEFQTSRLISDLISPLICHIHAVDPAVYQFYFNTKNKGDFTTILNLVAFKRNEISYDEIFLTLFKTTQLKYSISMTKKNLQQKMFSEFSKSTFYFQLFIQKTFQLALTSFQATLVK
ncbi:hypothetical protein M9Y10_014006 [Tritrichomonas musculus]|uniref:Uncharacterized protein n=1 Tax=Tritrichomonas musculus TaxID=1915356 RepID=A0ABR2KYE3_9EUKA